MAMIANSANRSLIAGLRLCTIVGQVFNLRRIVNPPAALLRARPALGESPTPFAALPLCGAGASACQPIFPARAPQAAIGQVLS
jgi:hypothetical protein